MYRQCTADFLLPLAEPTIHRKNLGGNEIRSGEKEMYSLRNFFGPARSPHRSRVDHRLSVRVHALITMVERDHTRRHAKAPFDR